MVYQYVTKAQRQHGTTVTSVPLAVKQALGLKQGDYLMWQVDIGSTFVQLSKVVTGGKNHGTDSRNTHREDQGGRT